MKRVIPVAAVMAATLAGAGPAQADTVRSCRVPEPLRTDNLRHQASAT